MRGSRAWRIGAEWGLPAATSFTDGRMFMATPASSEAREGAVDELGSRVRDGQQHLLDGVATGRGGDVLDSPHHRYADERQSVAVPVVVEDRHRHQSGDGSPPHLPDGLGPGVAAADDGHAQTHPTRAALPGEEP